MGAVRPLAEPFVSAGSPGKSSWSLGAIASEPIAAEAFPGSEP